MVGIDGDGVVRDFTEKPDFSNLTMANAAVYAFDLDAIQEILIKHTFANDIARDILPHFLGRIQTFEIQGFHMDMGTLENLNLVRNRFEDPQ
jgi:NDP-sugar pyrophosphorylase family protein